MLHALHRGGAIRKLEPGALEWGTPTKAEWAAAWPPPMATRSRSRELRGAIGHLQGGVHWDVHVRGDAHRLVARGKPSLCNRRIHDSCETAMRTRMTLLGHHTTFVCHSCFGLGAEPTLCHHCSCTPCFLSADSFARRDGDWPSGTTLRRTNPSRCIGCVLKRMR